MQCVYCNKHSAQEYAFYLPGESTRTVACKKCYTEMLMNKGKKPMKCKLLGLCVFVASMGFISYQLYLILDILIEISYKMNG